MPRLILYATAGCHLCECARDLLVSMPELQHRPFDVVDIDVADELLARYGQRIPVLAFDGREIGWPFNADEVIELLCA